MTRRATGSRDHASASLIAEADADIAAGRTFSKDEIRTHFREPRCDSRTVQAIRKNVRFRDFSVYLAVTTDGSVRGGLLDEAVGLSRRRLPNRPRRVRSGRHVGGVGPPVRNTRRNLPSCTSSPLARVAESTVARLT
jgi:hypothetical protein